MVNKKGSYRPPRPDALRREHRKKIFHWRTMNITWPNIAKRLNITTVTAQKDYNQAKKEFDQHWQCEEVEKRLRFLQVIMAVIHEAWDNYIGLKALIASEPSYADKVRIDRNLNMVLRGVREARAMLGVDVPKRIFLESTRDEDRQKFIDMMTGISESIEGPAIDLGLVETQDVDRLGGNGKSK